MSRRRGASIVTSRPPIEILPPLASSSPAIMRKSVVLPHPDGPTRTMNSPSPISRSTPSTARTPFGKTFVSCSSRTSLTARLRALGACVDHQQPLLRHLANRVVHSLAAVPRKLLAAVGHVVDTERDRLVDVVVALEHDDRCERLGRAGTEVARHVGQQGRLDYASLASAAAEDGRAGVARLLDQLDRLPPRPVRREGNRRWGRRKGNRRPQGGGSDKGRAR